MSFNHQTRGVIAQILAEVTEDAVRTFIFKHLGLIKSKRPRIREVLRDAPVEALKTMLVELVANNQTLRSTARHKDIFDHRVDELERWALQDGWIVDDGVLVRVAPMAENVTGLRDKLVQDLAASRLDSDNEIRATIEGSSKAFVVQDFNSAKHLLHLTRLRLDKAGHQARVGSG